MYDEFTKAFEIFRKYPHSGNLAAEHDVIYAGPDHTDVSDEDKGKLSELGWAAAISYGCFQKFV